MTTTAENPPSPIWPTCNAGRRSGRPNGPVGRTGCGGTSSATAWSGSTRPRASRCSRPAGARPAGRPGRAGGDRRRVRLGQVDAAQHPLRAGRADRGHRPGSAGYDLLAMSRAQRLAYRRADGRLRLAADRPQPAAVPDRAGERGAADAAGRAAGQAEPPAAGGRAARPARRRLLRGPPARADVAAASSSACAIAVALANDPEVLFADEPTGELDDGHRGRGLRRRCARSTPSWAPPS